MLIRPLSASGQQERDPLQNLPANVQTAVRSAVTSTASYKGRPWSHTEYNMQHCFAREHIVEEHGEAAGAAFDQLMARQPVRGGSFNPWSGD